MAFDPKCYDLAEHFLSDEEPPIQSDENKRRLAQTIQNEIENWIEYEECKYRPVVTDASL